MAAHYRPWGNKSELPLEGWFRDNYGPHVNAAGIVLLRMVLELRRNLSEKEKVSHAMPRD